MELAPRSLTERLRANDVSFSFLREPGLLTAAERLERGLVESTWHRRCAVTARDSLLARSVGALPSADTHLEWQ